MKWSACLRRFLLRASGWSCNCVSASATARHIHSNRWDVNWVLHANESARSRPGRWLNYVNHPFWSDYAGKIFHRVTVYPWHPLAPIRPANAAAQLAHAQAGRTETGARVILFPLALAQITLNAYHLLDFLQ